MFQTAHPQMRAIIRPNEDTPSEYHTGGKGQAFSSLYHAENVHIDI